MTDEPLWPLTVLAAKLTDICDRLERLAPEEPDLHYDLREVRSHLARHAAPHRTVEDHVMIAVARDRGKVILDDGSTVVLVAWRYTGHRNRARIEYRPGRTSTVPCSAVVGVA